MNKKSEIIQTFLNYFKHELKIITHSAKEAHEAATHEESKAEDRHDTFAIEASYLAEGQAVRAAELEKTIFEFEKMNTQNFKTALSGALVTLECAGKKTLSILANHGGGAQITFENKMITVLTPHSPLGESIFNSLEGDEVTVETKAGMKEYLLLKIE